jgi:hypothetical protein
LGFTAAAAAAAAASVAAGAAAAAAAFLVAAPPAEELREAGLLPEPEVLLRAAVLLRVPAGLAAPLPLLLLVLQACGTAGYAGQYMAVQLRNVQQRWAIESGCELYRDVCCR